jgi:isoleucyl-tRNA synthetase
MSAGLQEGHSSNAQSTYVHVLPFCWRKKTSIHWRGVHAQLSFSFSCLLVNKMIDTKPESAYFLPTDLPEEPTFLSSSLMAHW